MSAAVSLVPTQPQERTHRGIGASSAAAAIGVSEYHRPIDAWLEATGRTPSFAGNEKTRWGEVLEPVIRAHYVERNGVTVHVPPESLFHSELTFVRATPDGIVISSDGKWQWVAPQVKNVGLRQAPHWDGNTPTDYLIQGVVEMAVCDLPRIDFAVLIGGQEYREVSIDRDLELEADVLEGLAAFWRLVETDTQPAVDGSRSYRSYLLAQARKRLTINSTPMTEDALRHWRDAAIAMKLAKAQESAAKNLVLAELAAAGANKLVSPELGTVSIGDKPRKTVKWSAVVDDLRPMFTTLVLLDKELQALRVDAESDDPRTFSVQPLVQRVEMLRAQLRLAVGGDTFEQLIARHTKPGEPAVTRPRTWTANAGGPDDSDDE